MHIKFEDVQAIDDKLIFQTSRKCSKNFNQREISHRHHEVELWFFHNALCINPLPNDKILDWSKFKVFADVKINVNQKLKFTMGRVEHIAGKGENAGYQHFLLFPQCFQKASFSWSLKVGIVW